LPTVLQIENREDEYNPYVHSPQDNIDSMNLGYWEEQIKATISVAAHLAVPASRAHENYLPVTMKVVSGHKGRNRYGPR
jgi:hypothetical protein